MRGGDSQEIRLLVIGYGNELRRDDGVGPKVVAAVAAWNLPNVRTLIDHQLTPEFAEPIASARRVVFVDASLSPGDSVHLHDIEPHDHPEIITHVSDPRSLLALARQAFGRCPPASWLSIPVQDLDFGEGLSQVAQKGVGAALEALRRMAA
jgi:hydrogenase maturation protease